METLSKLHYRPQPLSLLLSQQHPSLIAPPSFIAFRSSKSTPLRYIKASYSTNHSVNSSFTEAIKPIASSILKSTCVAIAAAALVIARFNHRALPALAAPISPLEMEKEYGSGVKDEEKERNLEEYILSRPDCEMLAYTDLHPHSTQKPWIMSCGGVTQYILSILFECGRCGITSQVHILNTDDVEALRSLMEVKIKKHKLKESIGVIDRLIKVEPEEKEWPLLKAHVHNYNGEYQLAREQFEKVLAKDPLRVEAYHGLVTVVSQSPSASAAELKQVFERIEKAMESCKKESKKEELRDFKLLVAQVKVTEGKYSEALNVYQDLVKEEPTDFRPYLCMGIIYTLLKKSDEAEKQFEKYKRLVPKEHPYAEYFNNNMIATKVLSQNVARETASSKS